VAPGIQGTEKREDSRVPMAVEANASRCGQKAQEVHPFGKGMFRDIASKETTGSKPSGTIVRGPIGCANCGSHNGLVRSPVGRYCKDWDRQLYCSPCWDAWTAENLRAKRRQLLWGGRPAGAPAGRAASPGLMSIWRDAALAGRRPGMADMKLADLRRQKPRLIMTVAAM